MTKPRTENGVIVRCVQNAPAELSGLYLQPFYIHLNTDLLRAGDRLSPVSKMEAVTIDSPHMKIAHLSAHDLVVQDRPEAAGVGYLYKVCHTYDDKNCYYPSQLIAKDAEFEYIGNHFPELKYYDMWIMNYVKFN